MRATNIQIKRVYDVPEASDGMCILVDRLWPRGIKKESLQFDDWAAPAVTLLYAVKDPQVNHAIVLKDWLERQVGQAGSRS